LLGTGVNVVDFMIHEVLLGLVGHVGGLIEETEKGFVIGSRADFLSEAERQLVEEVVQVGFWCKRLDAYTKAVRRGHFGSSHADGGTAVSHYAYGLALRIEAYLREYRTRVVELETQVLTEPTLPLAHLASFLEADRRTLLVLHRLVHKMDELSGGPLLDFLWDAAASHMGVGSVHKCLWSAVEGAGQVLVNQLVAWLVYGRLVDPGGEFFIVRARGRQPPWTQGSIVYGSPTDDLSSDIGAAAAQREWQTLFSLRSEAVPRKVLSLETARKVLFVGKTVRVLLRSGRWLPGIASATPSAPVYAEVV
jgi:hypothetical protein